jgi:hypothetical protein
MICGSFGPDREDPFCVFLAGSEQVDRNHGRQRWKENQVPYGTEMCHQMDKTDSVLRGAVSWILSRKMSLVAATRKKGKMRRRIKVMDGWEEEEERGV